MSRRPPVRYLIVGGGPAGTLAAHAIRKGDPDGSIRILTEEPARLYNRTLLSKDFLLGADAERISLKDPRFYVRNRIELETEIRVVAIDARARTVLLPDGSSQPWEKLLVATGARPVRFDIPGALAEGVCVLRSLADAGEIRERAGRARRAVCVGAGFIGVEVACALRTLGLEVELAMRERDLWPGLVPESVGRLLAARLEEGGIRLHPLRELAGFGVERGHVCEVRFAAGSGLGADLVVLGLGVIAEVDALRESGIPIARGVLTDATLATRVPDVYAAGDVAEFTLARGGPPRLVGHWSNALHQGRLAGANMAGAAPPRRFDEVPWCDTRLFDLEIAFVGEPRSDLPFVIQGSLEARRFIAFCLERERLVGTIHVNRSAEVPAAIELLRSGVPIDPRFLATAEGGAEALANGVPTRAHDPS